MQHLPVEFTNSPMAPTIERPSAYETAALDGYWLAIAKHIEAIKALQVEAPGWLPEFKMINVAS